MFIDDGPFLPSLEHLVEHFMRFADGLPVNLKHPVVPKPKPPLPLFSTMPRSSHKKSADAINVPQSIQNTIHGTAQNTQNLSQNPMETAINNHNTPKKKAKDHSNSVFGTLRLRSPKKSSLLESMGTLRKHKQKQKVPPEEDKGTRDGLNDEQQLKHVETLLKGLSFSTEFSTLNAKENGSANTDEFYNVPKNNCSIESKQNEGPETITKEILTNPAVEQKTDEEVEYLTKSDVLIERERNKLQHSKR